MAEQRAGTFALTNIRLSFPKIWKKEKSAEDGKPKYSLNLLMDPETESGKANIALIEKEMKALAKRTWNDKGEKVLKALDKKRKPLLDGDDCTNQEGDVYQGYEGMMAFKAANPKEFKRLDRDKSIVTEEEADAKNILFGGCYVDAVVNIYSITDQKKGGNGIFASIEVLRHRRYGEPFGAAPVDEDDYLDDLPDDEDEDNLV
jgi:hypothetical protein